MYQVGDCLVIPNGKHNGFVYHTHPFVVVDAKPGEINGMHYDIAVVIMSALNSAEKIARCQRYKSNVIVTKHEKHIIPEFHNFNSFIKLNQLIYIDLEKVNHRHIGDVVPLVLQRIEATYKKMDAEHITVQIIDENLLRDKNPGTSNEAQAVEDEEEFALD